MNILFLTNHLNVGGITTYVFSLAVALKKRGHSVYIASSGGDALTRFTEQGIIFIKIPIKTKSELNFLKIGASFFSLLRHMKEKQIEIIHSNSRVTQVLGCLLSRRANISHITTWHGFFKNRLSRRVFPCWPDRIIAISSQVKNHLEKDFFVESKDISLVYNGVDLEKLKLRNFRNRNEVKTGFGLKEGPVVGIIARLSDVKGHLFLIQAMVSVVNEIHDAQLLVIGEGKMEKSLRQLARSLGIEKKVIFMPKISNIQEALYVMDVFVMPSLNEGLGLGLMEAMAWGKAVIGSDVGGIKDLIRNGENGLLVRPKDPIGLSFAILDLLKDPTKSLELGNNARIFIEENFALEKMVSDTEEVYGICLREKS
jgi:glycosyltransferase involved in cell wall biosynthesis